FASKIAYLGIFYVPGYPIEELRKDVLDVVLKWHPDVKIVAQEAEVEPGTVPDAYNKTRDMLRANPNIDAFWAIYDMPMIGAAQAIEDMKLAGKVGCYGFDGDPTAMKMIMNPDSAFEATVAQQPFKIGQTAAETAIDLVNGKEVPVMKFVPSILVTRDNAKEVYNTLEQYKK
ncbi:MAG TPA: substrate-binding domain-containing protein, partial [Clostridiaceae bacterium]|nr:substrate-binding domain-containing protein [Clostridiaceae bacterium]